MAISDYAPNPVPLEASPQLRDFLDRELRALADRINIGILQLPILGAAPSKPSNGMIVYADGTAWDPGSGAGFYGYESGAWTKL